MVGVGPRAGLSGRLGLRAVDVFRGCGGGEALGGEGAEGGRVRWGAEPGSG